MKEQATSFLRPRWLLVLLLNLTWATMGGATALAERGDFGPSSLAAKTITGAADNLADAARAALRIAASDNRLMAIHAQAVHALAQILDGETFLLLRGAFTPNSPPSTPRG